MYKCTHMHTIYSPAHAEKMKSYHLQGNGDHHNKQTKPDSDELKDIKLKKTYLKEGEQSLGGKMSREAKMKAAGRDE